MKMMLMCLVPEETGMSFRSTRGWQSAQVPTKLRLKSGKKEGKEQSAASRGRTISHRNCHNTLKRQVILYQSFPPNKAS